MMQHCKCGLWMSLFLLSFVNIYGQEFLRIEKLNGGINSDQYDESAPVLSLDGQLMFFTRTGYPDFDHTLMDNGLDLSKTLSTEEYYHTLARIYQSIGDQYAVDPVKSILNQDIWYANVSDTSNIKLIHPPYPANNALPNSIVSTAIDTGDFLTINQFYKDGSMYAGFSTVSHLPDGQFSFPRPLHIYDFELKAGDVNMSMSFDGDILVISMRRYDSLGENDLYVCFRMKSNVYSPPKHMGTILNTNGQETTPYISRNKRRLYFSSNREGSFGGNDIYYSDRIDYSWLKWNTPKKLDAPFNSEFDDSQPFIDEVNSFLYFSSKRDGSSDIFRVLLKPTPKLEEPLKIYGQIRNKRTGKLMQAELLYGPSSAKGYLEYFGTQTGYFEMTIEDLETYKFYPFKRKFNSRQISFDVSAALKSGELDHQLILYLDPKDSGQENTDVAENVIVPKKEEKEILPKEKNEVSTVIDFKNITAEDLVEGRRISFYDIRFVRSQATIMKRSSKALLSLYQTMREHPSLEIVIEGHTDNVGNEKKNVILSEQRAKSVKGYLVKKGISENRIGTKGFGPHRPMSSNNIESEREKNRRVEIRIVKK